MFTIVAADTVTVRVAGNDTVTIVVMVTVMVKVTAEGVFPTSVEYTGVG